MKISAMSLSFLKSNLFVVISCILHLNKLTVVSFKSFIYAYNIVNIAFSVLCLSTLIDHNYCIITFMKHLNLILSLFLFISLKI